MSYQVIARKWRPQGFDEVTGQEPVTRTLRNAIEHERLHHAYLFSGARGVGKTTTARLLAKAVNCHRSKGPTPTPCRFDDPGACSSCREITEGRSIDVLEIDAASNTQVEKTREVIINNIGIAPARDRYKVFIIDEVHMLSTSSFNALLKTLEEPPPRVLFVMATTEQHRLPDTILSRCQQFEFRTIAAPKIAARLRLIADAEGVSVSDEALREIARAGEGSMRDAQSAFDQVISFSEGAIEPADVEAALGLAGAQVLARVVRAVAAERPGEMIAVVDELVARGHDLRNFCRDLLAHLRDLLVFKVAGDSAEFADEAERRAMAEAARDFSESDLVRLFHSLSETERQLRDGVHPRYQLEIGLVKLVEMRRLAPLAKIIERLNTLEEALRGGRAPAGGSGGETPPAADSGTSPRRGGTAVRGGGAAGGGGGAALSGEVTSAGEDASAGVAPTAARAPEAPQTFRPEAPRSFAATSDTPQTSAHAHTAAERAEANGGATPHSSTQAAARANNPAPAVNAQAAETPAASFGAGRAAVPNHPNLKLVPSPGGSAAPPAQFEDAPFPLGDEVSVAGATRARSPYPAPAEVGADASGTGAARDAAERHKASAGVVPPDSPAASAEGFAEAEANDTASLIRRALEARNKPLLAMAIEGARRVRVEGEEVCVEFEPDARHLREMLNKPDAMRLLREVCCEALGRGVGFRTELRAAGAADGEPLSPEDEERLARRRLRERAEGNPALRQVLKTFRAEIIDVRPADDAPHPG
jgi:DNA polymerase III subunit gamma/tau